jgi:hypothetical protein
VPTILPSDARKWREEEIAHHGHWADTTAQESPNRHSALSIMSEGPEGKAVFEPLFDAVPTPVGAVPFACLAKRFSRRRDWCSREMCEWWE